jgi:hypothetical protein
MVTLCGATCRDNTPANPVSPERTPMEIPKAGYVPGDSACQEWSLTPGKTWELFEHAPMRECSWGFSQPI